MYTLYIWRGSMYGLDYISSSEKMSSSGKSPTVTFADLTKTACFGKHEKYLVPSILTSVSINHGLEHSLCYSLSISFPQRLVKFYSNPSSTLPDLCFPHKPHCASFSQPIFPMRHLTSLSWDDSRVHGRWGRRWGEIKAGWSISKTS